MSSHLDSTAWGRNPLPIWERVPEQDRRIGRGDDHAGDAWRSRATGLVRWVAVGHDPNGEPDDGTDYAERRAEGRVSPHPR